MPNVQLVFPNGKYKALTLSYDDGAEADRRLVALLNRFGLKGTFHLCSGWLDTDGKCSSSEIKSLYEGHEVAAHSATHPTLTRLSNEAVIQEVIENRRALERLVEYPVKGFSYPNGAYDTRIMEQLGSLGISYARTVRSNGEYDLPRHWHEWHPSCHHNDELLARAEQFILSEKPQYINVMYVWGHSYEFDRDQNWDMLVQFCKLMQQNEAQLWFATNRDIYNYMKRYEGLQFSSDSRYVYNPYADSVWLRVDTSIIEIHGASTSKLY